MDKPVVKASGKADASEAFFNDFVTHSTKPHAFFSDAPSNAKQTESAGKSAAPHEAGSESDSLTSRPAKKDALSDLSTVQTFGRYVQDNFDRLDRNKDKMVDDSELQLEYDREQKAGHVSKPLQMTKSSDVAGYVGRLESDTSLSSPGITRKDLAALDNAVVDYQTWRNLQKQAAPKDYDLANFVDTNMQKLDRNHDNSISKDELVSSVGTFRSSSDSRILSDLIGNFDKHLEPVAKTVFSDMFSFLRPKEITSSLMHEKLRNKYSLSIYQAKGTPAFFQHTWDLATKYAELEEVQSDLRKFSG